MRGINKLNLKMRPNETQGFLITFCGLDGSGKSTMMNFANEYLKGRKNCFITKQPTNAVRESLIFRTYMDCPDHSAFDYRSLSLLAASDRVQHTSKVIEPHLKNGEIILSDRYFYSCLANLRARGFKKDRWIYEIAETMIKPDIAFFFDAPVGTAIKRVRSRPEEKERYIDHDLQIKLRKEYRDICESNEGVLISTTQSVDNCCSIITNEIERMLENGRIQ